MSHVEERHAKPINYEKLIDDLSNGKIVGVVRGNSEHGPRALGNRSIICNPAYDNMKDILNQKVKNREWYRPFAPVCKLEDVSKYFNFSGESRWMGFCPTVKEEWREKLVSITHVDGTARVQTVTEKQNPWLYNLLTEFEKKSGIGVLLNTSFNVNGKPILSRYTDAIQVYDKTQMDCLILNDYYFTKH
jgi:predicted NodU family carbamoyl transferase